MAGVDTSEAKQGYRITVLFWKPLSLLVCLCDLSLKIMKLFFTWSLSSLIVLIYKSMRTYICDVIKPKWNTYSLDCEQGNSQLEETRMSWWLLWFILGHGRWKKCGNLGSLPASSVMAVGSWMGPPEEAPAWCREPWPKDGLSVQPSHL